jgi:predicted amidohydrolase
MLINLTCVQKKVGSNSIDEAIEYLEALIVSLSYAENRIVLLPEVWVSGFDRDKLFYFAKKSDELLDRLKILSNRTLVNITGTIPTFTNVNSEKLYNSFIFFSSQGELVANYRKIHPTRQGKHCESNAQSRSPRKACVDGRSRKRITP